VRKSKILLQDKIEAAESYINGKGSLRFLGKQYGVHHSCIEKWVIKYKAFGAAGLESSATNRKYSQDLKKKAVGSYLDGGKSLSDVCIRYGISTISLLQHWVKVDQVNS